MGAHNLPATHCSLSLLHKRRRTDLETDEMPYTPEASAVVTDEAPVVIDAQVVALFPPRPDAIVTLLHSPDFLPGTQTLLYSLKKTLKNTHQDDHTTYPPEIVVLVTPDVPPNVYKDLCPALCTRILPIEHWNPPAAHSMNANLGRTKEPPWQRSLDNHCPGWTKLRIFGLQQYETILYIDSDCLVLHDVTSLIALNKVYTESEALIAAAPDILPPHHFNSGVMVIRPSTKVMTSLKRQAPMLNTQDRSDTGILNAYFNTWNTEFPPMARLSTGYNAQQAMHDMTSDAMGNSSFWDTQVASDLHIVHYSNPIKPWQTVENEAPQSSSLHKLWKTWYTKSQNMLMRHRKEKAQRMREQALLEGRRRQELQPQPSRPTFGAGPIPPRPPPAASQQDPRQLHKLISKRFKELKRQGKSAKDAMRQANDEFGQGGSQRQFNPGTAVAAMFGMTM